MRINIEKGTYISYKSKVSLQYIKTNIYMLYLQVFFYFVKKVKPKTSQNQESLNYYLGQIESLVSVVSHILSAFVCFLCFLLLVFFILLYIFYFFPFLLLVFVFQPARSFSFFFILFFSRCPYSIFCILFLTLLLIFSPSLCLRLGSFIYK